MKKQLFISVLFLFFLQINGQEYANKNHINKINQTYTSSLDLTKKESKEFRKILLKFNKQLYEIDLRDNNSLLFNKTVKLQTIEIFNLLSSDQFKMYKKLVLELEPYKRYRL